LESQQIDREELITCIGRNIDLDQGVIKKIAGYFRTGPPPWLENRLRQNISKIIPKKKKRKVVTEASQNGAIFDARTW
jgi:hypothetical protein